ncbi:TetR/AcrR family transcriptional regulator [Porticoccaceae bacterium]|nr:TetR/AcrR family transcriptional regulator [Porticoccaceae bacterium]MDA8899088.1 TetR/AcrR family transcriptional regulator [Porticoccaceae bacterium]
MSKKLSPRNVPVQQRAHRQRDKILKATSELLETVGVDELTTIRVAEAVGISVGTLYHYFPNKHAILHSLAENWIETVLDGLVDISQKDLSNVAIKDFVVLITGVFEDLFIKHRPLLPLINAINTLPELNSLKVDFNQELIKALGGIFIDLDICASTLESERLSSVYWQLLQGLLLLYVDADPKSDKTLSDIKYLQYSLLERAKGDF